MQAFHVTCSYTYFITCTSVRSIEHRSIRREVSQLATHVLKVFIVRFQFWHFLAALDTIAEEAERDYSFPNTEYKGEYSLLRLDFVKIIQLDDIYIMNRARVVLATTELRMTFKPCHGEVEANNYCILQIAEGILVYSYQKRRLSFVLNDGKMFSTGRVENRTTAS